MLSQWDILSLFYGGSVVVYCCSDESVCSAVYRRKEVHTVGQGHSGRDEGILGIHLFMTIGEVTTISTMPPLRAASREINSLI